MSQALPSDASMEQVYQSMVRYKMGDMSLPILQLDSSLYTRRQNAPSG